jgi:predicted dehydrogenase
MVHAPVIAAGPETALAGVWARRSDAAERLASRHGTPAFSTVEELFDNCDAVSFAVPPDVQAAIATKAARAGKHVLLEKPIALSVDDAQRLADAVGEAGVASMVVLSWRYAPAIRAYIEDAHSAAPIGGRGAFVSGALLGGDFATPWRLERGPMMDLGPHVFDLLDATIGTIVGVRASGDLLGWVGALLEHEGGQVSTASLCASAAISPHRAGVDVFTKDRVIEINCTTAVGPDAFGILRSEFAAAAAKGGGHPLDVHHGLRLQRLLNDAESQLRGT